MASEKLAPVRARYREEALRRGVSPRDVDLLLSDIMQRPLSYLVSHGDADVDSMELQRRMERRYAGEPLQYIRGTTEFYSRKFYVDDRVLIPRPETEILVETALTRAPRDARVLDVGTGSGCIAISIERTRTDLRVAGADISVAALAVAAKNRRALESNIDLIASDILTGIRGTFDLIVSNPPYIAAGEVGALATEVKDHEPRIALTPGDRGTEVIDRLLGTVRRCLAPEGVIMIEIGYGQAAAVRTIADMRGFVVERIVPDLAGIPRVAVLTTSTG
ncbi:MAG: peptide chain release factor N(5)-glutamine methyltransferase [Thermoanaerobaculia bacterium]